MRKRREARVGITLREAKENYGRPCVYVSPRLSHPSQAAAAPVGTIAGVSSIYVMVKYPKQKNLKAVPANCLYLVEDDDDDDGLYDEYCDEHD